MTATGTVSPEQHTDDPYRDYVDNQANQILVARQYEDLILDTFRDLGIQNRPEERESSQLLGLTLLTINDVSDRVKQGWELFREDPIDPNDLVGMVLNAIKYAITKGDKRRWMPTIGRNRLVGHVDGTNGNVIVRAGDNDPEPEPDPEEFPPRVGSASTERQSAEQVSGRLGIRVAIVDTALRPHPFLFGRRVTPVPEPFEQTTKPRPFRAGHGTFVTGIVLGRAPEALVSVHPRLEGEGRATSWDVANAILNCARDGAQIINLSLCCYTFDGLPPLVFTQAINRLPADTLVIAAAGNMGNQEPIEYQGRTFDLSQAPAWPAALDNVVAVGAVDEAGQRAEFSPDAPWVDVLAPGVRVPSILPAGLGDPENPFPTPIARWDGTSFATANITGAVAALATARNLSPRDAYLQLREPPNNFTFLTSGI